MSWGVILSNFHQCWFGWLLSDTRSVRENTQHCKINNMGGFDQQLGIECQQLPTFTVYGIPRIIFFHIIPTHSNILPSISFWGASKHPPTTTARDSRSDLEKGAPELPLSRSQEEGWSLLWKGCDEGFYWVIKLGELCGNLGGFRFFFPGVYR